MEKQPIIDTDLDYEDDESLNNTFDEGTTLEDISPDEDFDEGTTLEDISSEEDFSDTDIPEQQVEDRRIVVSDTSGDDDHRFVMMGDNSILVSNVHPEDVGASMVPFDMPCGTICPICPKAYRQLKRHVVQVHLPYYWYGWSACYHCKRSYGTIKKLAMHNHSPNDIVKKGAWADKIRTAMLLIQMFMGVWNTRQLLDLVKARHWYPTSVQEDLDYNSPFLPVEKRWLAHYDLTFTDDYGGPTADYKPDPPNRTACLVHWRIAVQLLAQLSAEQRRQIFSL